MYSFALWTGSKYPVQAFGAVPSLVTTKRKVEMGFRDQHIAHLKDEGSVDDRMTKSGTQTQRRKANQSSSGKHLGKSDGKGGQGSSSSFVGAKETGRLLDEALASSKKVLISVNENCNI